MKLGAWLIGCVITAMTLAGCCDDSCRKNAELAQDRLSRIQDLEAAQERQLMRADELQRTLDALQTEYNACQQKVGLMDAALADRMADLARLTEQVGQVALPVELSNALSDWAMQSGSDLVTYDAERGIVRFKSDLLFDKGQDTVQASAATQLKALAGILNSASAQNFDILVVGHTDDVPIKKPETRAKHPTNWHLSAHRAISVQKILASTGIVEARTAVVGMGEFRPIEPNKPNQGGNPLNRRVEIYIVPAGSLRVAR